MKTVLLWTLAIICIVQGFFTPYAFLIAFGAVLVAELVVWLLWTGRDRG
jgi:hypothetical protein